MSENWAEAGTEPGADPVAEVAEPTEPVSSPASPTQLSVLPTPEPEPTGVPAVDAALDRLAELGPDERDPAAHVEVFEDVHARLQDALGGTDAE